MHYLSPPFYPTIYPLLHSLLHQFLSSQASYFASLLLIGGQVHLQFVGGTEVFKYFSSTSVNSDL